MAATSHPSFLAPAAGADHRANGQESGSHVPRVSEEYMRVWSELARIRLLLCYRPTDRSLLSREKSLAAQLKEIER